VKVDEWVDALRMSNERREKLMRAEMLAAACSASLPELETDCV
jgi:hypothetical protein